MLQPLPTIAPNGSARPRIRAIDALRGLVMLLMLVDHTREAFYSTVSVADPLGPDTPRALFLTRLTAHFCAPVFVFLTGLAAWLYAQSRGGAAAASDFLWKRGLFLIALELSVINFAWSFDLTPAMLYLQVIWVIGLSMLALAVLVHLPRPVLIALALAIVLGHNLLDGVHVAGEPGHAIWAVLHERTIFDLPWGWRLRISYPLLPWIGVIALGYALGPWFAAEANGTARRRALTRLGLAALALFVLLRATNIYGDLHRWQAGKDALGTALQFVNLTKYPPSADFLLATLGVGLIVLAAFEHLPERATRLLAVLGGAPLFFYLFHLYLLRALNLVAADALGVDGPVSVPNVATLWLLAAVVAVPCWFATRAFGRLKRGSDAWWLRYL
ncbi:DUF1624 domain-containing protein [Sphingomonas pokkalii]|uniref:Heparan-alpha-glucosaminide N-acetyltransferase catalytic domain-containing protein n=1 Tax=Sphingomonas pokkalii TaxID=2175090 RepID=A0A2U0SE27_9SPHN|nr:heparan-alpha-glucosaminide N-acetyltransferase domain-containing protein [Sphingomonas pokkalii]PVX29617.1 hypothetical protein DD559_10030 [Sphingomonas pokkalii]